MAVAYDTGDAGHAAQVGSGSRADAIGLDARWDKMGCRSEAHADGADGADADADEASINTS